MCGRYTIRDPKALAEMIERITGEVVKITARYNVAPSQTNPVVKMTGESKPQMTEMRWGIVPFWDRSEKPKIMPINARAEEMMTKPMFKQSVQERRCVVPADGFFEWHRLDEKTKVPFYIGLKDGGPFYIAGIYEKATETRPDTYALLTTGPNELMEGIHDRMPVILDEPAAKRWLEPGRHSSGEIAAMCGRYPADRMRAYPVSTVVNSPRNDIPECVQPAGTGQP